MENVLLITVDSLRPDHMGCYGYDRDTTPRIDEYADRGSKFTNAFAHVGGTQPSFPGILSSVHTLMYGGPQRISDEQTLVSEAFSEAGYQTGGFHSNLWLSGEYGYERGFDEFFDSKPDPSVTTRARRYAKKNLQGTFLLDLLKRAYDSVESSSGINVGSYHVPADEMTDMAVDYIEGADPDRPTFLWVHYMDVHHPFLPPEEYQLLFRDSVVDDREAIKLRRKAIEDPDEVTDAELDDMLDLYDAEIRFTDDEVARLVDAAEAAWDDLTVAITADHGEHFVRRGSLSGHRPYDEKLHVPLIVDGWGDDGTYDDLVGLNDLSPTLVDQAGLDSPDTWCGRSLRNLVFDGDWDRDAVLGGYGDADERVYMYRDEEWKYIQRQGEGREELYHLPADPKETDNVADRNPAVVERCRERIEEYAETLAHTSDDAVGVEMDAEVEERLERLGYKP
ncbi:sulfatase [Halostella salina]|uniref:sulfatase n=1 Tax=Halostella salina TaxID=1547897 RepID=UPI000EF75F16|nr:sulfatase [Halostella salina]